MANELKYGDRIHLQNGYQNGQGGYLDSNGNAGYAGAKYGVSTADSPNRAKGTGTWEILSASGKASGQPVRSGDLIYLRNLYGGDGGYLDTNSAATDGQQQAGARWDVTTSQAKDRATGTGRWRIFAQTSSPADQQVRFGDTVLLWNTYGDHGGFLETNGAGPAEGKYDVCVNAYYNRTGNVADWKIQAART
ncbi:hypothetical protein C3486_05055 [Streptomyces sp. Ru73]|uniref:hypothetical protein n=1 Tax=Streptomyces sp. Ru73 TaxID=2080748 RepID=UPI000CDD0152|nr:hypothetical protein [Streptomyces sp. Ru73]POX42380.1 hypothetical protein C3486_05055 [Streptomyces sp. Ru73]